MNTKQLPYLIAIAETGNLSAAAHKLNVSQPALSKYLTDAEREYGMPLFYREKRQLKPTEAGDVLIAAARQILDVRERTRSSISGLGRTDKQTIRVGITPHRGAQVMAMIYPHLLKRFPNVQIATVEGYAQELLNLAAAGEVDFSLVTAYEQKLGLHMLPFYDEEIVLSVPVFHNLARLGSRDVKKAPKIDLADFRDSPFVVMGENSTLGGLTKRTVLRAGFEAMEVFSSDNVLVVDQMIKTGAGVGLIPWHYAKPCEEAVYFRLKDAPFFTLCMMMREEYVLSKPERYLMYLKVKMYDERNIPDWHNMRWTEQLRSIMLEFDSEYDFEGVHIHEHQSI